MAKRTSLHSPRPLEGRGVASHWTECGTPNQRNARKAFPQLITLLGREGHSHGVSSAIITRTTEAQEQQGVVLCVIAQLALALLLSLTDKASDSSKARASWAI